MNILSNVNGRAEDSIVYFPVRIPPEMRSSPIRRVASESDRLTQVR
jgi:hypothetical protein